MKKHLTLFVAALAAAFFSNDTLAKSAGQGAMAEPVTDRYIVVLNQPSLVERMVTLERSQGPQSNVAILRDTEGRLELNSDLARDELGVLDRQFEDVLIGMSAELGRDLQPDLRYRMGLNGFSVKLNAQEAKRLATLDGVRFVRKETFAKMQTDAGPRWIGAEEVWNGAGNLTANRGAGVVVGIIDSGINWDHPSFQDPGQGGGAGYDHVNPYGSQLGLCSKPSVLCNDKLVGVYDFVQDIPGTEFVENNNDGFDDGDHGAHTAGTVAGNPVDYEISGVPVTVSGVAPNANIVSYRVCHRENPDEPDAGTCAGSWILAAIDQAIADGVDVINYSLGSEAFDPWFSADALTFLNAVNAGIFIAVSAGNSGPDASTVGSPANAPWLTAVGAATHDRQLPNFTINPNAADLVTIFSSRGPALAPVQDILKPNVMAPGSNILAADNESTNVVLKSGTSMSSPHVAGAAALILADRPGLSPSQVASMLELSATDEIARNYNLQAVDHFDTGAGRIQVDQAIQLGVYLDETAQNFFDANPAQGGSPRDLNLASLSDANCRPSCTFTRRIGSFASQSWSTSVSGLPAGVQVTVAPQSFTLNAGQTQEITVSVDTSGAPFDEWVFGKIIISNPNFPNAVMPLSVLPASPRLPEEIAISTNQSSGFRDFEVAGLPPMTGAVFATGGLQESDINVFNLVQDPTNGDAFDGGDGVATLLIDVPPNTLLLHADTPASDSNDVDLFVGFDANGNGRAEEGEVICESTTPQDIESCDIIDPLVGDWWVVVQNWDAGVTGVPGPAQAITLATAVVSPSSDSTLVATGPGTGEEFETFNLRLAWNNLSALNGSVLWGALRVTPNPSVPLVNEVVPVRLERNGIAPESARPLLDNRAVEFALAGNSAAEALYIDVPPGVTSLDVLAAGRTASQSNGLRIELVRQPFNDAFANAPGVSFPASTQPAASGTGGNGQGPRATVNGGVTPGRWFVVVENTSASPASVSLTAGMEHSGSPVNVFGGLWQPASRPGINQGFEYTPAGNNRAFLWYTYDQDGSPVWYIASAAQSDNNSWTSDLFRFTNDGPSNVARQTGTKVGQVGITMLGESDAIMSWTLFGVSGSDRAEPLSRSCPESVTPTQSFTGLWYRGADGLGGASIVANRTSQAHIHYLYDGNGQPRWLLAAGDFEDEVLPMNQFSGFCPTCTGSVTFQEVGSIGVSYSDNATGIWEMDFDFLSPASGGTQRRDGILRLSDTLSCVQ